MQISALNITGFSFLFIIAFILGLLTLSLLTRLREEGEASREVVLDSLMTPMRDLYRPVSSILPYHISEGLLYRHLKRIPIPGLDVALSVAAYQVADTARFGTKTARCVLEDGEEFDQVDQAADRKL